MALDWQAMFKRYLDVVGRAASVAFIHAEDWNADELAAIAELQDQLYEAENGLSPTKLRETLSIGCPRCGVVAKQFCYSAVDDFAEGIALRLHAERLAAV